MDTPNRENTLLHVMNLRVGFTTADGYREVVKGINFTVKRAETFALVGESGGGKTITALSIMQLLPETAIVSEKTQILLEHQDLLQLSEIAMRRVRGRRIAMVFQEPMSALNPVFTVGEQIAEVLRHHTRLSRQQLKQAVISLLQAVEMTDPQYCAQCYPHQLSGGMQQRVVIAMAIAAKPDLLIADEPTSALDVTTQVQILALLQRLQRESGMSILLITHDLSVVKRMAHRVGVLYQGHIVEQNTCDVFFAGPEHAYSRKLLQLLLNAQVSEPRLATSPLLTVEDLRIHFPIRKGILKRTVAWIKAVDGISFTVAQGKTLAVVGESGSGKTTLAKSIVRLLTPTTGKILFQAINLADLHGMALRRLHKDIQIIFQDPYSSLNPRMVIADIIAEGMVSLQLIHSQEEKIAHVDRLLQLVELPADSKFRYPHEFSGGQRQRIGIARALAVSPKLLVCDEPTSALDVSVQTQILGLLKRLQTELGLSYLFITHNLAVVRYMADDVVVMYRGKIVEQGSVEAIFKAPQHPYTRALLESSF